VTPGDETRGGRMAALPRFGARAGKMTPFFDICIM